MNKTGCGWEYGSERMRAYHDHRWGKPEHDDTELFAMLILEGAQAGLSWATICEKEENYRAAFDGFDPRVVAAYGEEKKAELLQNPGIVRNRLKIQSAITNAGAFLKVQEEFGSFDAYIWGFTQGQAVDHRVKALTDIPAETELSGAISKDLKRRGFKFVGPTIVYAYMQAIGMVNDHLITCAFR